MIDALQKSRKPLTDLAGSEDNGLRLSVVAPCYNEALVVDEFVRRMDAACVAAVGSSYEILLVNDGSSDETWTRIQDLAARHQNVVGVDLFRNHGHQLAVTAGISLAEGGRILLIDADLQDPPELLLDMMSKMDQGFDVVYGKREERAGESIFKKITAAAFYRILKQMTPVKIPVDAGDFRLMSRRVADVLNSMPERHRFVRGMVAWIGGRQTEVPYRRDKRYAGESKYTLTKMVHFALDAITSFSVVPLRAAVVLAFLAIVAAIVGLMIVIWIALSGETVPGWASLAVIFLLFSGIQLFALGILGEYVGRSYMQLKMRPMFIVRDVIRSEPKSNT